MLNHLNVGLFFFNSLINHKSIKLKLMTQFEINLFLFMAAQLDNKILFTALLFNQRDARKSI